MTLANDELVSVAKVGKARGGKIEKLRRRIVRFCATVHDPNWTVQPLDRLDGKKKKLKEFKIVECAICNAK